MTPSFNHDIFGWGKETAEHSSTMECEAMTVLLLGVAVKTGGVSPSKKQGMDYVYKIDIT